MQFNLSVLTTSPLPKTGNASMDFLKHSLNIRQTTLTGNDSVTKCESLRCSINYVFKKYHKEDGCNADKMRNLKGAMEIIKVNQVKRIKLRHMMTETKVRVFNRSLVFEKKTFGFLEHSRNHSTLHPVRINS